MALRARLGELSVVCRGWTGPAQRLMRTIWTDRDPETTDAEHLAAVQTIVWTIRGPDVATDRFHQQLARCPNASTVYCHKPPPRIILPPHLRSLISTGLTTAQAEGGLKAPQLTALAVLQLNPEPYAGWPVDGPTASRLIEGLGCGAGLTSLTLNPVEHYTGSEDDASARSIIAVLSRITPRLRCLTFADEIYRSSAGQGTPEVQRLRSYSDSSTHCHE